MKKARNIPDSARAAWSASGKAHIVNLTRKPALAPEIEQRVQTLVHSLLDAIIPTPEALALVESVRVSFRVVMLAASRPITAYFKRAAPAAALTAHQSNLARCLKELREMYKPQPDAPRVPSAADLLAPFRAEIEAEHANAVSPEQ